MNPTTHPVHEQEYDFTLLVARVAQLTEQVEVSLFNAGCDDATLSFTGGLLRIHFSRRAASLQEAISSAIRDVNKAHIGAAVLEIDEC